MASGLILLLDDVAAIAKLAATTIDDVAAVSAKAGAKAAGVVIDDAAVTPGYVVGLTPDRELPIIGKIALGSLKNKLLILLPAALALSAFAPWLLTPLLMLGGSYLCFEAAEKVIEALSGHGDDVEEHVAVTDPVTLEQEQVSGAIRTDFILSGEIMAIALKEVADKSLMMQGMSLIVVAMAITFGVYGAVGLIIKMDDVGLHLVKRTNAVAKMVGRGLVAGMTLILRALTVIGTAAMVWVGGGIVLHGLSDTGFPAIPEFVHHLGAAAGSAVPSLAAVVEWIANATMAGVFGLIVGGVIVAVHHLVMHRKPAVQPSDA